MATWRKEKKRLQIARPLLYRWWAKPINTKIVKIACFVQLADGTSKKIMS